MAPRKSAVARKRMNSTRPVAEPRRQPRWANQSTAGSRAKDRNNATTSIRMRSLSRVSSQSAALRTTTPAKNMSRARGIHGGIVCDPDGTGADVAASGVVPVSSAMPARWHGQRRRRWMPRFVVGRVARAGYGRAARRPPETALPAFDDLIDANQRYAAAFDAGDLAPQPRRRLAVLTCMDCRIDTAAIFGLAPGDAHVLRNAGARASD